MRSNMPAQKDFARNPSVKKQRSVFNRSHGRKTTFDVDYLVPFLVDEILPGDTVKCKANLFARLSSTLQFPIMDNMHLDTFYFYVPNRILQLNWEKLMGAKDDPSDDIDFQVPQVTTDGEAVESLTDQLGIPPNPSGSYNAFPYRAYIKIWNEWFRDENLQDSVPEFNGDGPEVAASYPLQKRGKRHDYFTSCLPSPQKGDPVGLPFLAGTLPVYGDGTSLGLEDGNGAITTFGMAYTASGIGIEADSAWYDQPVSSSTVTPNGFPPDNQRVLGVTTDPDASGLVADLSGATALLINDLRLAVATQQLLETDARGGTRYFEILKAHFGIDSPDGRLQRPEYLGGSSQMINVNPVTQTSESNTTEQGNQSAYVTANSRSGFSKSFVEHGTIIGLVNVRADLTYQQGLERMWSRTERYDFYFPAFANLGEQAVLNKEIYHNNEPEEDDVFGYQEQWAEYRYKPSQITGRFRSDAADSLEAWHLSQDFADTPVLGDAFITETMPIDRITTSSGPTVPDIIMDSWIEYYHARCMPVYSIPGLKRL